VDQVNSADIKKGVAARVDKEEQLLNQEPPPPKLQFIEQCAASEKGLSILLIVLMRLKVLFDVAGKNFYLWTGHYWQLDRVGQAFNLCIDTLLETLSSAINELYRLKKERVEAKDSAGAEHIEGRIKILDKAIDRLQGLHYADKVLTLACRGKDSLAIDGNRLDCKPWLWPCVNATIELRVGEARRKSNPADFLTRVCPTEWKGINEPAPLWEKFLLEISNDREDWVEYQQKVMGLAMIGKSLERIFPIWRGDTTNGKGTEQEVLLEVLGPLAGIIEPELFLATTQTKSGGPQPDLVDLKGLRIGFASETDESVKFSTAKVKRLCGNDSIKARNPHAGYITFQPSHTLFLICNHLPRMTSDDPAFWKRARVVPFDCEFVDRPEKPNQRPIDYGLKEKLLKEASGILAWCVRGCLKYLQYGITDIPACIQEATGDYKGGEDIFSPFVKQALIAAPGNDLKVSEIYNRSFKLWAKENGMGPKSRPGMKRFSEALKRRWKHDKDGHEVIWFLDISIAPEWQTTEDIK